MPNYNYRKIEDSDIVVKFDGQKIVDLIDARGQSVLSVAMQSLGFLQAVYDSNGNVIGLSGIKIPYYLFNTGIPIGLPAGNGSTTGLQFTNTAGAFSMTTTLLPKAYTGGVWMWMPIGAFDGTNPTVANFYWATASTTSVGVIYNILYQSTIPTAAQLAANPAVTSNARWLTQTTAAVPFYSAQIQGNTLGNNGSIQARYMVSCTNDANTKTINILMNTGVAFANPTNTSIAGYRGFAEVVNAGAPNIQTATAGGQGSQGIGTITGFLNLAVDTTGTINPGASGQLQANTDCMFLEYFILQVSPF